MRKRKMFNDFMNQLDEKDKEIEKLRLVIEDSAEVIMSYKEHNKKGDIAENALVVIAKGELLKREMVEIAGNCIKRAGKL
jgi:hypothetical protein